MGKVSYYKNLADKNPALNLQFSDFVTMIRNGEWQDVVLNYRARPSKDVKMAAPCIIPGGVFKNSKQKKDLITYSGIINIDIDTKDNPDIDLGAVKVQLFNDPFVLAGYHSIGGEGLSLFMKINPTKHSESFLAIEKHLADEYHIMVDQQCKNLNRLRFVSYDPDAYYDEKSVKWVKYLEKKKVQPHNYTPVFIQDDIDFVIDQIRRTGADIAPSYSDWIKIGFSLATEFGEAGRDKFHTISQFNSTYDHTKCDRKFTSLLKNSGGISIASFFWIAKEYGLNIKTPKTRNIERVAIMRRQGVGRPGGQKTEEDAKKSLEEVNKKLDAMGFSFASDEE